MTYQRLPDERAQKGRWLRTCRWLLCAVLVALAAPLISELLRAQWLQHDLARPIFGGHALLLPARGRARVLVTGFEPFGRDMASAGANGSNPAELVAAHLGQEQCRGAACVTALHLPVNRSGVELVAASLREGQGRSEWDAVLHLGFESVAKGLRLEIAAANVLAVDHRLPGMPSWSADVPCNTAGTGFQPVDAAGPCLLATTAPLDRLDLPLPPGSEAGRAPLELWSRDAGTYYCNEVYYRTLLEVRSRGIRPRSGNAARLPVLFVHLPPLNLSTIAQTADFVWGLIERIAEA